MGVCSLDVCRVDTADEMCWKVSDTRDGIQVWVCGAEWNSSCPQQSALWLGGPWPDTRETSGLILPFLLQFPLVLPPLGALQSPGCPAPPPTKERGLLMAGPREGASEERKPGQWASWTESKPSLIAPRGLESLAPLFQWWMRDGRGR